MSSDHHELGPADAGRYARDVREAIDRVLEEVRVSLDSTLRRLATTIAADARASDLRFSDALRRMDEAPSLRGVLDALMDAVGHETDRSALLILSQRRLRGWSSSGFVGLGADPKAIDLPSDPDGLLGAAIRAKAIISSPSSIAVASGSERPQFAQGSGARDAIAVPVVLGGTVAAVLYADSPTAGDPSSWTDAVNRLVRYAELLLEARTTRYLTSVDGDAPLSTVSAGVRGGSGGPR
ncbi:MAG: GAF domain-containing protein [Acidobacteria bacterium]|nr:GAF domain-containing protein [Acidobacteriota bacterium]